MAQHKINLPVIDFFRFDTQRYALAKDIDQASRGNGFFYVVNHGISKMLVEDTFLCAKDFFALSLEKKQAISLNKSKNFRGYFSLEQEKLDFGLEYAGDYKEGIKIGRDLAATHPLVQAGLPLHGANQWPLGLPKWKETINAYITSSQKLGTKIMASFALALGAPEEYFESMLTEPMVTLAPLHYPPAPEGKISGAGAHSDYGCLTMVNQQDIPGLQVLDRTNNTWLDVPILKDALVVNIGDMLQRWSNNIYRSTVHRVVNTSDRERYSLAFFFDPNFNASLEPIPGCVGTNNPAAYKIMTAGEYMLERMNASFTKY